MKILTSADNVVVGRYGDLARARLVIDHLSRLGVPQKEFSVLTSGDFYPKDEFSILEGAYLDGKDSAVEQGAEAGVVAGATGGALLGLGAIALPGASTLLVAGAVLLGAIAGMSAGALAGGAIGVLMEIGFSESQAQDISTGLNDGQVLILVENSTVSREKLVKAMSSHKPEILVSQGPSEQYAREMKNKILTDSVSSPSGVS